MIYNIELTEVLGVNHNMVQFLVVIKGIYMLPVVGYTMYRSSAHAVCIR